MAGFSPPRVDPERALKRQHSSAPSESYASESDMFLGGVQATADRRRCWNGNDSLISVGKGSSWGERSHEVTLNHQKRDECGHCSRHPVLCGSRCGCVCLQDQWWWLDNLGFLGWRQMVSPLRSYLIGASEQGWVSWIEICLRHRGDGNPLICTLEPFDWRRSQ